MKRSLKLMGLVIFLGIMLIGLVVTTQIQAVAPPAAVGTAEVAKKCCIAGEYKGHHKDIASTTCPKPEEGDFKMVINQDKGCGSKIWGKVISSDGTTQDFTGTVTLRKDGCCNISGGWTKPAAAGAPGERTDFKGILCKKGGKWTGKGDYRTTIGAIICNGKWNMTQM
jgi:hypothetical protein